MVLQLSAFLVKKSKKRYWNQMHNYNLLVWSPVGMAGSPVLCHLRAAGRLQCPPLVSPPRIQTAPSPVAGIHRFSTCMHYVKTDNVRCNCTSDYNLPRSNLPSTGPWLGPLLGPLSFVLLFTHLLLLPFLVLRLPLSMALFSEGSFFFSSSHVAVRYNWW